MSLLAVLCGFALLTLGLLCGCWLAALFLGREMVKVADLVVDDCARVARRVGPRLAQLERELSDFLVRGTTAATAEELAQAARDVAAAIDPLTIKSGWGDSMSRWDTMFRVECERLGLRCSGPQYRAARRVASPLVEARCKAAGTPPPLIIDDDPDDLDATRDGSSGVRA